MLMMLTCLGMVGRVATCDTDDADGVDTDGMSMGTSCGVDPADARYAHGSPAADAGCALLADGKGSALHKTFSVCRATVNLAIDLACSAV